MKKAVQIANNSLQQKDVKIPKDDYQLNTFHP